MNSWILGLLLGAQTFAVPASQPPVQSVARPTQYVMIGFDGGLSLPTWQDMHAFTQEMKRDRKPLGFTYFVSGVYFLQNSNRNLYTGPHHKQGYSMISFGDNNQGISDRVDMMNTVFTDDQEIASHANGHFHADEDKWNLADWTSEFTQFNDFTFNAFFNNNMTPNNRYPQGYAFAPKDVVGFRAPNLGSTSDLFPALKNFGFTYDASTTGDMGDWPRKDASGIWRYPVPLLNIAGTAKRTLGMDYNFYWVQSQAKEDLPNRELYRKQMYDTYMNYFMSSYYGKRGPVYIGHHFVRYNGGAYWDALKDFTRNVCGQPEVKCVTFKQYTQWLESLNQDTLKAYRSGSFEKLPQPRRDAYIPAPVLDVNLALKQQGDEVSVLGEGKDFNRPEFQTVLKVNSKLLRTSKLNLQQIREHFPKNTQVSISAVVLNRRGQEVQRVTHLLEKIGTPSEHLNLTPEEKKALVGDMPEAHEEAH
ncbi:MAG: hypothetical protein J7501_14995 [Bdellovibrio sp.]|nr:hypothetical protein [Bdellovibrio sp.]